MGNRKISPDLKFAAMKMYEKGLMDLDDILDCVGFKERTFYRVLRLYRDTGEVVRPNSNLRGRPRKLDFDDSNYLVTLVNHRPDWFLDELDGLLATNRFMSVHWTTIQRTLERAGISVKKIRRIAQERNEDVCADFVRQMGQYGPEEIGFLDEFSKDERTLHRRRGRSKKGTRSVMRGAFVRGRRVSGEGLLTLDGIVASTVVEGSMTRDKFLFFLEHSVVSLRIQLPFSFFMPVTRNGSVLANLNLYAHLDAIDNTIPRAIECPRYGQCPNSPWRGYFRAYRTVWCVNSLTLDCLNKNSASRK
jgi:transposase